MKVGQKAFEGVVSKKVLLTASTRLVASRRLTLVESIKLGFLRYALLFGFLLVFLGLPFLTLNKNNLWAGLFFLLGGPAVCVLFLILTDWFDQPMRPEQVDALNNKALAKLNQGILSAALPKT